MTKKQTIEAFCALASKVSGEVFNEVPSDCFCTATSKDAPFTMSKSVVQFIFDAVTEKIERIHTNEPN